MKIYPRSPAELPSHYNDRACGIGVRAVLPPQHVADGLDNAASSTAYKKTHSEVRDTELLTKPTATTTILQSPNQQPNLMDMMGTMFNMAFQNRSSGSDGPFRKFHSRVSRSCSPSPEASGKSPCGASSNSQQAAIGYTKGPFSKLEGVTITEVEEDADGTFFQRIIGLTRRR